MKNLNICWIFCWLRLTLHDLMTPVWADNRGLCVLLSVCFIIWGGDRVDWGRDASSLVHRPALRPLHHLCLHHLTLVHPKRDRHPEIHKVNPTKPLLWVTRLNQWTCSLHVSVLGTLAATYLCVAVVVKFYLMDSSMSITTPEHSQGSVPSSFSHVY